MASRFNVRILFSKYFPNHQIELFQTILHNVSTYWHRFLKLLQKQMIKITILTFLYQFSWRFLHSSVFDTI